MRLGFVLCQKQDISTCMQGTGFGLDRLCFSQSWERSQGQAGMKSAPVEETWNSAAPRGLWQRPGVPPAYYSGFWILDSDAASLFLALGIPLCPTFARVGTWQAAQPYRYPRRQPAKPLSEGAVRAQQKKGAAAQGTRKRKTAQRCLVGDSTLTRQTHQRPQPRPPDLSPRRSRPSHC